MLLGAKITIILVIPSRCGLKDSLGSFFNGQGGGGSPPECIDI